MAKIISNRIAGETNNVTQRSAALRTSSSLKREQKQLRSKRIVKKKATGSRAVKGAQKSLRRFRQSTLLAVAITSFMFLILLGTAPDIAAQIDDEEVTEKTEEVQTRQNVDEAADEALTSIQEIWHGFLDNIPKLLIAIAVLIIAWLLIKLISFIVGKTVRNWKSGEGVTTLTKILLWLFTIGIVVTVVAGDIRALLGSVGLIGLALSWALQSPIESFTGWLMNSFKNYYRVGDRIAVGDVFGDVYKIDFLNTTVWEIGSPHRGSFVLAEQPTGRLVTFPNNEVLNGTVVNLTRDFPFVWDELAIAVGNESDLNYSMEVIGIIANNVIGDYMHHPANQYEKFLQRAGLESTVPDRPQLFLSTTESWTNIIVRYLVGARERRKWKSELIKATSQELTKKEHAGKIHTVYPRQQIQFIKSDGGPTDTEFYR
ncbi:MAG: mechanosensitive ion channel family protein [Bacteroidia bacterium]